MTMENTRSRRFGILGILAALSLAFAVSAGPVFAAAAPYPNKPIRFIIPHAPGAGNDILGRALAAKLAERLGKPLVVDNRDGAGGRVGSGVASKAAPDGYTLLFTSTSLGFNPALYKTEDPIKLFAPIAKLAISPLAIVVHPSVPAHSVKELVAMAKQKPGQMIMASSSAGSINHLAAELFKAKANIDFKVVIFKGGGTAIIDLLGGHSHFMFGTLPLVISQVKSGKLRALATSGKVRSSSLPDLPTIADAVPGFEMIQWWGMFAPVRTPAPIIDKLARELKEVVASDEMKKIFLADGADVDYLGPADFSTFLRGDVAKWFNVIKEANIKVE